MLRGSLKFGILLASLIGSIGVLRAQDDAAKAYVKQYVRLTLREGADEPVERYGCSGKMAGTVMCRAITVTLVNAGAKDLHVDLRGGCGRTDLNHFWVASPKQWSTNPYDVPAPPSCAMEIPPLRFVLRPGGKKDFSSWVGTVGIPRSKPGTYVVAAVWELDACVGDDKACQGKLEDFGEIRSNDIAMTQPE